MNKIPVKYKGRVVGYYDPEIEQTSINKEDFDEIVEELGTQHIGVSSRSFAESIKDLNNPHIQSFDIIDLNPKTK